MFYIAHNSMIFLPHNQSYNFSWEGTWGHGIMKGRGPHTPMYKDVAVVCPAYDIWHCWDHQTCISSSLHGGTGTWEKKKYKIKNNKKNSALRFYKCKWKWMGFWKYPHWDIQLLISFSGWDTMIASIKVFLTLVSCKKALDCAN